MRCTPAEKVVKRWDDRAKGAILFMRFALAPIDRICVENPVGYMNNNYRKPSQIIEPYQFAESESDTENYVTKRTCLWLKGLPLLKPNNLPRPNNRELFGVTSGGKVSCWCERISASSQERGKIRSKTFPGIAKAMAEQWGEP